MRKVIAIVMTIGFLLMAENVFAYEQPEVTGNMNFQSENGKLDFLRYELVHDWKGEIKLLLSFTYTNSSETPHTPHEMLDLIRFKQNTNTILPHIQCSMKQISIIN